MVLTLRTDYVPTHHTPITPRHQPLLSPWRSWLSCYCPLSCPLSRSLLLALKKSHTRQRRRIKGELEERPSNERRKGEKEKRHHHQRPLPGRGRVPPFLPHGTSQHLLTLTIQYQRHQLVRRSSFEARGVSSAPITGLTVIGNTQDSFSVIHATCGIRSRY